MYEKITSDNVIMFAIKNYNNPQCEGELEFHDDLKRFKYIKRLFKKYQDTGDIAKAAKVTILNISKYVRET